MWVVKGFLIVITLCLRVVAEGEGDRLDLPELTTIELGHDAFSYDVKDEDNSSLIMTSGGIGRSECVDLPKLDEIKTAGDSFTYSFKYVNRVILEGLLSIAL